MHSTFNALIEAAHQALARGEGQRTSDADAARPEKKREGATLESAMQDFEASCDELALRLQVNATARR